MRLSHSKFSLPFQIALPAGLSIVLILVASFVFIIPLVREGAITRKEEMTKNVVDVSLKILEDINRMLLAGELTPEGARAMGKSHLKSIRYGQDQEGYLFVFDREVAVLMHPDNLYLEGQRSKTVMDKANQPLGTKIIQAGEAPGGAFITYIWEKQGPPSTTQKKLSYVKQFQPWGWTVGTGIFTDDVDAEVGKITHSIILITLTATVLAGCLGFFIVLQAARLKRAKERADEALARNECQYRNLFEKSSDATLIISSKRVLNCNTAACHLFGYANKHDLIGTEICKLSCEEQHEGIPQNIAREHLMEQAARNGYLRFEWLIRRNDGSIFPSEISVTVLPGEEGLLYYAVLRDITTRKAAENKLREMNLLLKNLIDNTPALIWIKDLQGAYLMVNRHFEEIFHCTEEGLTGKTDEEVLPEASRPFIQNRDNEVLHSGTQLQLDGDFIHDGKRRTCLCLKFPIRDGDGQISGLCCVATDITDRTQLEQQLRDLNENLELKVNLRTKELEKTNRALQNSLEQLQRATKQLVETEKMAALGELVAGIAHEINTPVGIGVTAASHLQDSTQRFQKNYRAENATQQEFEEYLKLCAETCQIILTNLQRAAEQVSSFKQIAVDQSTEDLREFNLREYLNEILISLHPQYRRTKHVININCPRDIILKSYPGVFSQIFSNLIMNSLIHGFERVESGRITIEIKSTRDKLYIDYNDNGKGIAPEHKPRIFTPFFTTRRGLGGSGLGMHITYNLVTRKLGGTIHCHSQPGYGTTFVIAVPLNIDPAHKQKPTSTESQT